MAAVDPLVSIGLPVRNGADTVGVAMRSVLAQDYENLELIVSDNASDDATEEICRDLARCDPRLRYRRQPRDIGMLANFIHVMDLAGGTLFKWIGDDDWLDPGFLSRCVPVLVDDPRLVLVTTQQSFLSPEGSLESARYESPRLRSDDPVERLDELLRLLNESHLMLDPMYALMRRERAGGFPRPNMLRGDEWYAAKLALIGPFAHIPEELSYRGFRPFVRMGRMAVRLGVPAWQARVSNLLLCRQVLRSVDEADLGTAPRARAYAAVGRFWMRRHRCTAVRRARKLHAMTKARGRR